MISQIDDIVLDKENLAFNHAVEFIHHTDKLIYLTGKAGTGKTTFLKYIKRTTEKNVVILAPTGVAAINAGGVTINSFFQIPFGPFVPDDARLRTKAIGPGKKETIFSNFRYGEEKRKIIANLELLIIDEISMVRCDTLDVIDQILKVFRNKPYLPFGGVQVILIGDTFQLPPIADASQWAILSQFYKTAFFFSSQVIQHHTPIYIELKKIYRQKDQGFIDLLNKIRVNKLTLPDFHQLNTKYNPAFSGEGEDFIILATHNRIVQEINAEKLAQLKTPSFSYEAKIEGTFPTNAMPTDEHLALKVGAQVMFVKNDTGEEKRFFNGKIGKIKSLAEDEIIVVFDNQQEVNIERATWENVQYEYNEEEGRVKEEVVGSFEQFPIKMAWAITVHKSQGLTFDKVIADLGNAFAAGQVYVALSRCTSFDGLVLKSKVTPYAVKTDPQALLFAQNETPSTLVIEELNTGKADFFYKKARYYFEKGNFKPAFSYLLKALEFRDDSRTAAFERYLRLHLQRLFSFKRNFSLMMEKAATKEKKLQKENAKLKEVIAKQKKTIIGQNKAIQKLQDERNAKSQSIHALKKKQKRLSNVIKRANQRVKEAEADSASTKNQLLQEQEKNKANALEIKNLQNRKWYQKLTGK